VLLTSHGVLRQSADRPLLERLLLVTFVRTVQAVEVAGST